jgi:hypothetical protein
VAKPRRPPIEDRIREAFEDYSATLNLVREYAAARQHPAELGILACARLDSLANLAGLGGTQSERFRHFLEEYSDQKSLLQQIAIPNLYSYLSRHHALLPGTIEIPGRVAIHQGWRGIAAGQRQYPKAACVRGSRRQ